MTKLYKVTVITNTKLAKHCDLYVLAKDASMAAIIHETDGTPLEVIGVEKVADRVLDRRAK